MVNREEDQNRRNRYHIYFAAHHSLLTGSSCVDCIVCNFEWCKIVEGGFSQHKIRQWVARFCWKHFGSLLIAGKFARRYKTPPLNNLIQIFLLFASSILTKAAENPWNPRLKFAQMKGSWRRVRLEWVHFWDRGYFALNILVLAF